MNKRRKKPERNVRLNTWPENAEARQTITSSQRQPASPAHRAPCSSSDWYHKVSVCYLECPARDVSCQCIVARLSSELRNSLPVHGSSFSGGDGGPVALTLALIAPHTFLYCESPRELREWRLHTGTDAGGHKTGGYLKLHEKHVSDFFTCCGPRGVWGGTSTHTGTYIDENSCPFHANFVVFVLKPELADQLKDALTIPSLPSLDETRFLQVLSSGNYYLSLIQRDLSGVAESHRILLKPPSSSSSSSSSAGSELSIDERIAAYGETSRLQYTCGHSDSSSGAAVVYFDPETPDNALVLAAMNLYSRRDDEVFTHCGVSLPAIFHAIAGSRVCGVVPCLSLLVGACNHGHWAPRFYQDLQECLHPRKDPAEDKQRRYRWISQLLTVCDYLSRDEAQAVLRLGVTDSPHIVLASLNLLSALLGCFEREIEMEGVSRFHCQINRVFLKRASERFYAGLETLFQRLYRHLVHTQSSDQIVTACVECWLKMCTLVGHKASAFYEVAKFTRVKVLRDSPRFRESAQFQRLFGDLCLSFLTHTRMTAHEAVGSAASRARIEELEREKEALQAELQMMKQELIRQERSCAGDLDSCGAPLVAGVMRMDSEPSSLWEEDMSTLLAGNQPLRETLGTVFDCGDEASCGVWSGFIRHLEERLRESLDPPLWGEEVSQGERLQLLVREWSAREEVTVNLFCEVAGELGVGQRIHKVLSNLEQQEAVPSLDDRRNSIPRII